MNDKLYPDGVNLVFEIRNFKITKTPRDNFEIQNAYEFGID